jgi:hypothetical protein
MPISFKCTGCRCRLHVPTRWGGTTVACPRCRTRVVVPGRDTAEAKSTRFERTDMERSLAALERPPAGALADPDFELPDPGAGPLTEDREALLEGPAGIHLGPAVALAAGAIVVAVFLAGFGLGVWWAVP